MPEERPDLDHIAEDLRSIAVRVEGLSLDKENARKHNEKNLDAIVYSLRKFGQVKPIVVDVGGRILAGNGTFVASQRLGWKWIAATVTKLSGPEATEFAIADNRTAELAAWETEVLTKQLAAMDSVDAQSLGWTEGQLDRMFAEAKGSEGSNSGSKKSVLSVVVTCETPKGQNDLFEEMKGRGFKCKLVTA